MRARDIFLEALEQPTPEARAAYLDRVCSGDPALRAEVEALLANHRDDDFLGGSGAGVNQGARETLVMAATEKPGDRIGHYKLLQQIGEGGCGVVYMAEQQEPVRRRVALKVIKLGMDTKQVVARFEAERQALALMDHPNIAKVFDAGATETGRPFFVMELVRGVKLTEYCDENKLSTEQRLELFIQVCGAVQHAHQKGVIHRDIKPSNILVTVQEDRTPAPKIIDFGIAKATAGQTLTDKTLFTAFEQFIGTPAYMSPEQAERTAIDIDTRSDIYSLGVLLYELLTGKTPFDPKELLSQGIDALRKTIREQEPVPPSTRLSMLSAEELTTTAHRRGLEPPRLLSLVRGDLDWIVMKSLEKDRTRRYETANALAMDLQRHLSNEPVVARPPSKLYEFQKTVRRHKLGFAATGAVILALAVGLGISIWSLVKERQDRRRAETEQAKSEQVARFMKDMLNEVAPSVAMGRDTTLLREILDKTAQRVSVELTNQPEVEAELSYTLGDVYFGLADFEKAELLHRRALELRRRIAGEPAGVVALSESHLGRVLLARHKVREAETLLRQALAQQRKMIEQKPGDVIFTIDELAIVLNVLGSKNQRAEAESLLREAMAIAGKSFGGDSMEMAEVLEHLGEVLSLEGKLSEGEAADRKGLAIRRKLPEDEFGLAEATGLLAGVLQREGKWDEAAASAREALAIQRKLYPAESPALAGSLYNLARALLRQGKPDEAEPVFREAAMIWRNKQVNPTSSAAMCMHYWGVALLEQGKLAEAESVLRDAVTRWRAFGTNYYDSTSGALYYLGCVLYQRGALKDAESALREAVAIRKRLKGKAAEAPDSLYTLGQVLCAQGRFDEAVGCYRESADQGNLQALDALARMYERGEGVPRNPTEASKLYRQIAGHYQKQAERGGADALNALGWLLATCEEPSVRDGHKAVAYAEKAVAATNRKNENYLNTLAAAYAENGEFAKAGSVQKEAIMLLKDATVKKDFESRLKLYQSNRPYHELSEAQTNAP